MDRLIALLAGIGVQWIARWLRDRRPGKHERKGKHEPHDPRETQNPPE